jgi:flagellar hook-associated protein FlgK
MSLFNNIQSLGATMNVFTYGETVIGNNIANAAVPGYALQTLDISSLPPINQDGLLLGSGVQATGVANTRNVYLDNQLRLELGGLGYNNARLSGLQQIAALFPEVTNPAATTGLQGAIANLASAWSALALAPNSIAAKQGVLSDMQTLAQMFNTSSQQLFNLQQNLNTQVNNEVTTINGLLDQVVTLNKEIKLGSTGNTNGQPNVLVDAREQVAEKLAQALGANSTIDSAGDMVVTFAGGTLADGNYAYHLEAMPSSTAIGFTGIGYRQIPTGTPLEVTSMINTGTLGGLLTARDQDVKTARLDLDKMAFGVINYSNQINEGSVAPNGTSNVDLFIGSKAADIQVNAIVADDASLSYLGATRDTRPLVGSVPGDLATMQSALQSMDMYQEVVTGNATSLSAAGPIDPSVALNAESFSYAPSLAATPVNPGIINITAGQGNAVPVQWNAGESLNTIIAHINAKSGGAFYATFDVTAQAIRIFSTAPLTIVDSVGNLGSTLMLSTQLSSSASINNSPLAILNPINPIQAMNGPVNKADLFTQPLTGISATGVATVNGINFNWTPNQNIAVGLAGDFSATNNALNIGWVAASQTVTVTLSGDQSQNPGVFTAGNPMVPISVTDSQGNLTQVLNLGDSNSNATKIFSEMISGLDNNASNTQALATQAQNLVTNTSQLQEAQSGPDAITTYDASQMVVYQRAFEAAARLQYVLDDMLNVLINQMGSPVGGSSTTTF